MTNHIKRERDLYSSLKAAALVAAGVVLIGMCPAAAQSGDTPARTTGQAPATAAERANANTVALVSGNLNGTNLSIAYDLSAVLDDGDSFRVLPIIGKGGGQNMRDILLLKGVDIALVQSSLLGYFQRTNELGRIDQKVAYIAKLFNEEVHVLVSANSGITSLAQLEGRRVNFSDAGSGTQLVTRDIFTRLGVKPVEVNMGQADAFEKLKSGDIAATILSAGKPTASMAKLTTADGFRFLPIAYSKEVQADYLPTTLTSQDYPGLIAPGSSVDSIAGGTLLVVYNWPKNTDRYRRIEKFVNSFFPRLAEFQKPPRHPKWRETVLGAEVKGWTRFPAAEEWLQRNKQPVATQLLFEEFVAARRASGQAVSTAENQQLFQEFMQWSKSRERR